VRERTSVGEAEFTTGLIFARFPARFLKEKLEALTKKDAFLDSDNLKDLNTLTDHVRDSDALVVVQSAELLQRPWCLLEVTMPSHFLHL
jgi:hypothetical protein